MLTHLLASLLNGGSYILPSQRIERTIEYKQRLLNTQDVGVVVDRFELVDLVLVGIGMLEPSYLLKTSGNYYEVDILQVLVNKGAVGDICLHYFDERGLPVLADEEDLVVGMDLALVKRCPRVFALVGGKDKAAQQGKDIDVLIVDYTTAKTIPAK